MGNLFLDDVYVKTTRALRSNHIASNDGTLVTVDINLAVYNVHFITNTIQLFFFNNGLIFKYYFNHNCNRHKVGINEIST